MAVSAYHAAIKAYIHRRECRNQLQLCREEVLLHNAILFMQQAHDIELHQIGTGIRPEGTAAD